MIYVAKYPKADLGEKIDGAENYPRPIQKIPASWGGDFLDGVGDFLL